jgi:hypothetical protein
MASIAYAVRKPGAYIRPQPVCHLNNLTVCFRPTLTLPKSAAIVRLRLEAAIESRHMSGFTKTWCRRC